MSASVPTVAEGRANGSNAANDLSKPAVKYVSRLFSFGQVIAIS